MKVDLDELASKLQQVKWNGSDKFTARCPAHDDAKASLAIRQLADRKVLHCFAGCTFDAIASSLGLSQSDFFDTHKNGHNGSNGNGRSPLSVVDKTKRPEFSGQTKLTRYEIKDIDGTLFAVHVRKDGTDDQGHKLKHLWWEQADGKIGLNGTKLANMPLYQTEILRETHPDTTIVVTEGEKAAQSLIDRGIVAVGTACGAAVTPSEHVLQCLAKFPDVVLWPDNDEAGREHMGKIASLLAQAGSGARIVDWSTAPPKGDAADFKGSRDAILQFLGTSTREVAIRSSTNGALVDPSTEELPVIIWEDQGQAEIANAEYLARPAIVDGLLYAQAASCAVGGKHHGKTTNLRTLALSVARGLPIWDRATKQGHVIYAASGDEVATTRMELLRMGWRPNSDPLIFARIDPKAVSAEKALSEIARRGQKEGTVLIILDMLFDFVRIADEMSYAGTREAIAHIQTLSDETKAHVQTSHHSPKYMTDIQTAATAALGSTGISARFSPIVLTRKWAESLYTIESTLTRDPRGVALPQTCIERDESGWAKTGGEFKSWMKWRIYSPRVLALFEGGDPNREMTVSDVAEDLQIGRPEAQNTLYQMCVSDDAVLDRAKRGRGYKYFLKKRELFAPSDPDARR